MRIKSAVMACALSAATVSCGKVHFESSLQETSEPYELCEGYTKPTNRYAILKIDAGRKVKVGVLKGQALVKVYEDKAKRDLDKKLNHDATGALYSQTFDYVDQTEKSRQVFGGEIKEDFSPSLRGTWFIMSTFKSGDKRLTNLDLRWNQKDEAHVTFTELNCQIIEDKK